ncbi:hypothetical protein DFP72DRAFT_212786 [Ephemerocybe angulata]|uniref:Uncharacterized protein n=1 Tax=Ephemerocybe angulata TaxID=980116 RepID=A0A8H6I382_9AGAR|nr:hypothetical protein DFP72DRAFT_212738 [Tulosesus angulatus]KAF6758101.1 hypothetical protein DFP72DRAFT_212786 [Tulosesus angulatus]
MACTSCLELTSAQRASQRSPNLDPHGPHTLQDHDHDGLHRRGWASMTSLSTTRHDVNLLETGQSVPTSRTTPNDRRMSTSTPRTPPVGDSAHAHPPSRSAPTTAAAQRPVSSPGIGAPLSPLREIGGWATTAAAAGVYAEHYARSCGEW